MGGILEGFGAIVGFIVGVLVVIVAWPLAAPLLLVWRRS